MKWRLEQKLEQRKGSFLRDLSPLSVSKLEYFPCGQTLNKNKDVNMKQITAASSDLLTSIYLI